jgi:23S rRNA pseudoU1915 N3-methylase RlmH
MDWLEATERLARNDLTLLTLNLSGYGVRFGDHGAEAIAEALRKNSTLVTLDLRSNEIGLAGAQVIADALRKNSTLLTLYLGFNDIGSGRQGNPGLPSSAGVEAIAAALRENSTLVTLELCSNRIGPESAQAIADALRENSTLVTLDLRGNSIGSSGIHPIADALRENSTLVTLELAANGIGPAGADAIADSLRENSAIVKLNLYGGHAGVDEPFGLSERETKSRIDTIIAENLKSRRAARLAARLLLPRLHLPERELVRKILLCLLPPTVVESTMPGVDASADPAAVGRASAVTADTGDGVRVSAEDDFPACTVDVLEHEEPPAQPRQHDAGYRLARMRLIRDEEWALETQRQIIGETAGNGNAATRNTKLFLVTLSKSWRGLHIHLTSHALLQACKDELEDAGYPSKLATGSAVFTDPENYSAANAKGGKLLPYHILVTKPYLKAVVEQVKIAPRCKDRNRVVIRKSGGIRLLANFFGPEGAELRTVSTRRSNPSDFAYDV